ncbi:hypothetical protein PMZ80_009191 [Knufia obscura]|uniref:Methyltransferase domain-containing protein n=2 Tax=Knufia TaxID=430999 RepID=A0AAN8I307_9EURO|nr:hypothetical protein PMZ80_009191 [Knufia obscura]KAK5947781.1 hypothetical protein OHC33_011192 [Knufia fluminis]
MSKSEQATYSHGHHASVISTHARRTAANSAQFLLPHIKPHFKILDLGCGPGTITADLAALVPQGSVIGMEIVESVLEQARSLADSRGLTNLTFQTGDANNLGFGEGEFDVVFCHQLLQHVKDPVGVLREMKRVCKSGGIVAAREADYASFVWHPRPEELERWGELYQQVARGNGGEPNAGRFMPQWTRQAGWRSEDVTVSWNSWCFTGEGAKTWAESWEGRALHSDFAKGVVANDYGTQEELEGISKAWKRWSLGSADEGGYEGSEDKLFVVGNGEVICRC